MSLEEAIKHCEDKAKEMGCSECAKDHLQLADWLRELKQLRRMLCS
ncbi:hypothetical protein [Lacrimispora sp.]